MCATQYFHHHAARRKENFPVASFLVPKFARPSILAVYDVARGADDIADDGNQPPEQREQRLLKLQEDLTGQDAFVLPDWAQDYHHLIQSGCLPAVYGEQLLDAFVQDTRQHRYTNWGELEHYCRRSAAPIGRIVLHLCQEMQADLQAADALCMCLQILNHIQDIRADLHDRDRIYLPQDWLKAAHVQEPELAQPVCSPRLRGVINQLLDQCDRWLDASAHLPVTIHSRRLRLELTIIWRVANRLSHKLRKRDPLAQHVRLSRWEKARVVLGC